MENLTYNNVSFSTFNTFWDGSELFITPEKDVIFFEVPGKNGDLTISNNRFKNKSVPINCFIRENFKQNYSDLVNFLYSQEGYQRLETSKEPDIYMMAAFVSAIEPDTGAFLKYGNFTLNFNLKPQKWLKSGETGISISSSDTVNNPTLFNALPLIEVTGTGTITINDSILELAQNTSTVYIDCEIQDAYEGTINRNSDLTITNGFPVLKPGNNNVVVEDCSINLIPRWWRV